VTPPLSTAFDGPAGRLAAAVMARMNRDMEAAAVAELDPAETPLVLCIGFGPGVGVAQLAGRAPRQVVAGIDPSATMVDCAARRNRSAVRAGRVVLRRASAEAIPWPDDSFDAVVAVNSMQLWHPLDVAIGEVARVVRPGGALVTVTHSWAVEKIAPVAQWTATMSTILIEQHFASIHSEMRRFRTGEGLMLRATAEIRPLLL